ncbi:hypothetical protein REPUB_Repub15cG0131700 [Reevesia pubescens]
MLEELTHLRFYFTNLKSFEPFIGESKSWNSNDTTREFASFRSFIIFVGQEINSSASDFNVFECSAEKHLKFSAGDAFPETVSNVLKQANSFELIGHKTAGNLIDVNLTDGLSAHTLQELEVCIVKECKEMQSIVNGNATGVDSDIKRMQSYKKKLFSLEMVRQLSKLQNLQVDDCTMIEKIIDAESTVPSTSFPELKNFQLCGLPRLSSICDDSLEWPSLKTILIKTCEALNSLPRILVKASKLREIQCAEDWWNGQHWLDDKTEEYFRTFRRDPS